MEDLNSRNNMGQEILNEISTLYPDIVSCTFGNSLLFKGEATRAETEYVIVLSVKNKNYTGTEKEKIGGWLRTRLKTDRIKLFFETVGN
jgi:hypothetical protein